MLQTILRLSFYGILPMEKAIGQWKSTGETYFNKSWPLFFELQTNPAHFPQHPDTPWVLWMGTQFLPVVGTAPLSAPPARAALPAWPSSPRAEHSGGLQPWLSLSWLDLEAQPCMRGAGGHSASSAELLQSLSSSGHPQQLLFVLEAFPSSSSAPWIQVNLVILFVSLKK